MDSSFFDVLKEKEKTANIPQTNSQTGSSGPGLTQGGLQNTFPTKSQQNVAQTNVVENETSTTKNCVDNDAPGAEYDIDVIKMKAKFPPVTWKSIWLLMNL